MGSSGSKWCPVRLLVNYLGRFKGHPWSPQVFLFCSLTGNGVPRRGSQISYGNAKSALSTSFLMIGFEEDFVKKFGLHSFRVGATSLAFSSGKLTQEEIQFSVRWNSSETPKTYNVRTEQDICKFSRVIAGGLF